MGGGCQAAGGKAGVKERKEAGRTKSGQGTARTKSGRFYIES